MREKSTFTDEEFKEYAEQIIERYPLPRRSYGISLGLTYNYNTGDSYGF